MDFSTSPDGSLRVVVLADRLFIHSSGESSLGQLVQQIEIPAGKVVMTQWIGNDEVRKVATAVSKIKR